MFREGVRNANNKGWVEGMCLGGWGSVGGEGGGVEEDSYVYKLKCFSSEK